MKYAVLPRQHDSILDPDLCIIFSDSSIGLKDATIKEQNELQVFIITSKLTTKMFCIRRRSRTSFQEQSLERMYILCLEIFPVFLVQPFVLLNMASQLDTNKVQVLREMFLNNTFNSSYIRISHSRTSRSQSVAYRPVLLICLTPLSQRTPKERSISIFNRLPSCNGNDRLYLTNVSHSFLFASLTNQYQTILFRKSIRRIYFHYTTLRKLAL